MGQFNGHRPPTVLKSPLNKERERSSKSPSQYIEGCKGPAVDKNDYHITAYHPKSFENFYSNISAFRMSVGWKTLECWFSQATRY